MTLADEIASQRQQNDDKLFLDQKAHQQFIEEKLNRFMTDSVRNQEMLSQMYEDGKQREKDAQNKIA